MTKTKIDGKWVYDKLKDYSNGEVSQSQIDTIKLKAQLVRMSTLLQAIDKCTKMTDVKILIRTAKAHKASM